MIERTGTTGRVVELGLLVFAAGPVMIHRLDLAAAAQPLDPPRSNGAKLWLRVGPCGWLVRSAGISGNSSTLEVPLELGRVAAFLLSPASSYITGTVVAVDGGACRAI